MLHRWLLDRRAFLKVALGLAAAPLVMGASFARTTKRLHHAAVLNGNELTVGERFEVGDRIAWPGRTVRVVGKVSPRCLIVT
jgi:hypothetical protein